MTAATWTEIAAGRSADMPPARAAVVLLLCAVHVASGARPEAPARIIRKPYARSAVRRLPGASRGCDAADALFTLRGGDTSSFWRSWLRSVLSKLGIFTKKGKLLVIGLDNAGTLLRPTIHDCLAHVHAVVLLQARVHCSRC